jgi:hypothetical protein
VDRCPLNCEFLQGPPAAGVTVVRVVPPAGTTVVAVLAPEGADGVNEATTRTGSENPKVTSDRFRFFPGVIGANYPTGCSGPDGTGAERRVTAAGSGRREVADGLGDVVLVG